MALLQSPTAHWRRLSDWPMLFLPPWKRQRCQQRLTATLRSNGIARRSDSFPSALEESTSCTLLVESTTKSPRGRLSSGTNGQASSTNPSGKYFHRNAGLAMVFLSDDEPVARFVLYERDIRQDRTVRPDVFEPRNGGCSVFHYQGLNPNGIWDCANDLIAKGFQPIGCADIKVRAVREAGLQLTVDNSPKNHATIHGFDADKVERKKQMRRLADSASYVSWASPHP